MCAGYVVRECASNVCWFLRCELVGSNVAGFRRRVHANSWVWVCLGRDAVGFGSQNHKTINFAKGQDMGLGEFVEAGGLAMMCLMIVCAYVNECISGGG